MWSACLVGHTKPSKNYILDLCQHPRLTSWDHKMKTPHASHLYEFNQIRNSSLPITMTEFLPRFDVTSQTKCLIVPHGSALPFLTQI